MCRSPFARWTASRLRRDGPRAKRLTAIGDREDAAPIALLASVALAFVMVFQVTRTVFPLAYEASEDASVIVAGLGGIAAFAAPILTLPLVRLSATDHSVVGVVLVAAARLAVQIADPIPLWLSFAATAVALIGVAAMLVGAAPWLDGRALAAAILAALAVDTGLHALLRTWDLVWQHSVVGILLVIGLVAAAGTLTAAARSSLPAPPGPALGRLWALGPYLTLQTLFLQNLGYVGSQAGVSLAGAAFVVLAADAFAVLATGLLPRRVSRGALAAASTIGAVLAVFVESIDGVAAVGLVLVLQVSLSALLALALTVARKTGRDSRVVLGFTLASVSFAVLTYLWQVDIQLPLPFPRVLLPAAAALLVAAAALRAAPIPGRVPHRALTVPLLAGAVVVPGWLWVQRPSDVIRPPTAASVRLVSFNVRGAVGTDGNIGADAIADSILAFDPDVVLLQEVARGWVIHGAGDLLAYLHDRLQMSYTFEPAADGQFGNAIFARLPADVVGGASLPRVDEKQRRSYVAIRVQTTGRPLVVLDTHIEGGSASQIDALLDAWGGVTPAVVAGDMNLRVGDEANVRRFTDAGLRDAEGATGDPCRPTSAEPTMPCDRPSWVFVTRDLRIVSFTIGDPSSSDHLPIYVTVSVPS